MIAILLLVWSVIPTILLGSPGYSNLGWLICIWLIEAYIRLYHGHMKCVKVWHGLCCLLVIIGMTICIYYIGQDSIFIQQNAVYLFAEMNKVPAVICSMLLFLGFKNFKMKSLHWLNNVATCTFGVYLFHDHPQIRSYLWEIICNNYRYINSPWLIVRIIICTVLVFCFGIAVEMIRQTLIKIIKSRRCIWQK
ncbi:MAG TPA: hypothetical protein DDY58_14840 [Terrisporobacter glycolicus]|nr:hypothetical protein [Terrisporobacter sp.]HBI93587.1 hypothetical protein [Terrisporobacter hibernicus]